MVGHAAVVWPGIRGSELKRAVQHVDSTAVLELRCGCMQPLHLLQRILHGALCAGWRVPPATETTVCAPGRMPRVPMTQTLALPSSTHTPPAGAQFPASWGAGTLSRPLLQLRLTSPLQT